MINLKRTFLLLVLGACLAAAGCGSDEEGDPIPAESAATLQAQLDNIQARLDNGSVGACDDILSGPRDPNVDSVNQAIASLPDGVDQDVRSGLEDGFDQLFSLVDERCNDLRSEADAQQDTKTTEEPPVVTETETVPPPETETIPPPETETLPPPETETQPPSTEEPPADEGDEEGGGVLAPQGDQG